MASAVRAPILRVAWLVALAGCGRLGFDGVPISVDGEVSLDTDTAVEGVIGPSCANALVGCGPTGGSSCCATARITGGTFFRGYDVAPDGTYKDDTHEASLSEFHLDKYEITVSRFRQFVDAGMGTQASPPAAGTGAHPNRPDSGWDAAWNTSLVASTADLSAALQCYPPFETWTDAVGENEERPINCITWFEAMAFCIWDGGYLPSEAEWNYAAAGGAEQRTYPWSIPATSTSIDSTRASYYVDSTKACHGDMIDGCARTDLVRPGSKPAGDGRWGHSDLAGNVAEWVLDWYAAEYPDPCVDCMNLTKPTNETKVFRGGYFILDSMYARAARRQAEASTYRNFAYGARCARAL